MGASSSSHCQGPNSRGVWNVSSLSEQDDGAILKHTLPSTGQGSDGRAMIQDMVLDSIIGFV